jgi:flagellar biosynthesis/type III secretory pathway protein FliH
MISLFERNFDEDPGLGHAAYQPLPSEPFDHPAEAPRHFTETEVETLLNEARDKAFAEGHAQGVAETREELETAAATALQETLAAVGGDLANLSSQVDMQFQQLEKEMVELSLGVAERVIPEFLEAFGEDLVTAKIQSGMRIASGNATLQINVSEDMAPSIQDLVASWQKTEFENLDIAVIPNDQMSDGSARLNWKHGYLEYNLDHVCEELLTALRSASDQMTAQAKKVS